MSACHSLEPIPDNLLFSTLPLPEEKPSNTSWEGRRVVAIKERYQHKRCKLTANEELLQRLLRRSFLNLPEDPSQQRQ